MTNLTDTVLDNISCILCQTCEENIASAIAELRELRARDAYGDLTDDNWGVGCHLCHCCGDADHRHGEILSKWVNRAVAAEAARRWSVRND